MKSKLSLALLIIGLSLFLYANVMMLLNSRAAKGSSYSYTIVTVGVILGLLIVGLTMLRFRSKKNKIIHNARKRYKAAYRCMIKSDPSRTYIIASDDTHLHLFSDDSQQTSLADLTKDHLEISVEEVPIALMRPTKGLVITMKPGLSEENNAVKLIILNDAKPILSRPLNEQGHEAARIALTQ